MTDVQEFSYKEAGETLDVPLAIVMSLLGHGGKTLSGELAQDAESLGIAKAKEAGQGL